ncbi:ornithine cyclodeaminase family protein [Oricola thermophila]|uniref:Ornithine cyclodeaminase n=1 Tax=Oricola thermophila TaxID=2742145 RepID=A0A6N1VJP7_9HYPH|nr:ornithine cyclodeaminase [Oricola thermophila]QKV19147.1 ornithine cyclodeaminase [Oricola thermophila]
MVAPLRYIDSSALPSGFGWRQVVDALASGHRLPRAQIRDQFLGRGDDACVNRAAWIEGLGIGVKSFTVFPGNQSEGRPSVQGAMLVFDDRTGSPLAIIDSGLITYWKTAADSLHGAMHLARPDSRTLLIVGTGVVAESLIDAYPACFPGLERILLWGRNPGKSRALAARHRKGATVVEPVEDLAAAAAEADIISTATMSKTPILKGDWIRPGTHVDLIGAFKADMREADDTVLRKARIFVDSYDTTIEHIGELLIPLEEGTISRKDVLGDLYDLEQGGTGRQGPGDITVLKNGGGAHLDLMTARALMDWTENAEADS